MSKGYTVEGITFRSQREAEKAQKEADAIARIRAEIHVEDVRYAKVLYKKISEKNLFFTEIGKKFLQELEEIIERDRRQKEAEDRQLLRERMQEEAAGETETLPETVKPLETAEPSETAEPAENLQPEAQQQSAEAFSPAESFLAAQQETQESGEEPLVVEIAGDSEPEHEPEETASQEKSESKLSFSDIFVTSDEEGQEQPPEEEKKDAAYYEKEAMQELLAESEAMETREEPGQEEPELEEITEEELRAGHSGLLRLSLVLNVLLLAAIILILLIVKNSDNVNILNYERRLQEQYGVQQLDTASPSDAE